MARIYSNEKGYFYEADGYDIELNENSFQGFQHRHPDFRIMDLIGVHDPRDDLDFIHWRASQPEEAFEEMMALVALIGTYHLTETPYDQIKHQFEAAHSFTEDDWREIEGLDGQV